MKLAFPKFASLVLSLVLSASALADFTGDMKTEFSKKDMPPITGKIYGNKQSLRMDLQGQLPMSMILDMKGKKAMTLMHPAKLIMDADLNELRTRTPFCFEGKPEQCMEAQGFKKVGTEKANGYDCVVYEGTFKHKTKRGEEETKMKLWHATSVPEIFTVRTVASMKDGMVITTNVENIKTGKVDSKLFEAPKDYKRAGNMNDLLKGLKGFGN